MLSKLLERHIRVDIGRMRASDFLARQERFELKKLKYVRGGHGWKTVDRCLVCDSSDYEHELEKHGIPLTGGDRLNIRIVPRLDIKGPNLVKGIPESLRPETPPPAAGRKAGLLNLAEGKGE